MSEREGMDAENILFDVALRAYDSAQGHSAGIQRVIDAVKSETARRAAALPKWSTAVRAANQAISDSEEARDAAYGMRCICWVDCGTEQCTADADPMHEHRHDPTELP